MGEIPEGGSVFHIHKWSKWKLIEFNSINTRSGKTFKAAGQQRKCLRCGKVQVEEL